MEGARGIRKLMLDANKIEQVLQYWRASFSRSVSATFVAQYLESICVNCGDFCYISKPTVVVRCCNMLRIDNRTSAHAWAQHCCTNLAKWLQHPATSANIAWKIWPLLNQRHPTLRNMSQHNLVTKSIKHVAPNNVGIKLCCVDMLWSFSWGLTYKMQWWFVCIAFMCHVLINIPVFSLN